jgi:drug/metabolite transporter (DMT)-like permease
LVKRASDTVTTLEVSLIAFLGGLPISLPLAAFELSGAGVGEITPGVVYGVLYLGLVSTALAMYLWNKSLALLDAGLVSLLFFAQPVVGAGLGAALLGERLTVEFWIGAVLIGSGLIIAASPEPGPRSLARSALSGHSEEM